jgi:diguanylate cyclase (GGDEF)-like protein/PAS domain S-box-containing protein
MAEESTEPAARTQQVIAAALSTISDSICVFDAECRFLYANQAFLDAAERSYDEVLGQQVREIVGSTSVVVQIEASIRRVVETQEPIVSTTPYTSYAGHTTYQEYIFRPFPHGGNVWVVCSIRDVSERVRLSTELHQTHQQSYEILESITDAFYALDGEWRFTYVNRHAGELLHRDPEELIGKSVWNEYPDARGYIVFDEFHSARATQEARSFEYFFDPLNTWFEVHAYPAGDQLSVYFRKNNEKIRIQRQLEANERRYRTLTHAMPQMDWLTDSKGYHLYYNRQWYEYTGLTEEESLGFGFANALHPDDIDRTVARWERAWRHGEAYEIEYRFYSRSRDEYRWFLGRAYPVHDDDGNIVEWVGTCTDIDHQKETERRLIESERRRAEAQRIARFGNWSYDYRTGQVTFSAEVGRIFGLHPDLETCAFDTLHDMIDQDDRVKFDEQLERVEASGGGVIDIEYRIHRRDGGERVIHTIAELEVDSQGQLRELFGTVHDVTERKEIEHALQEYAQQQTVMSRELQQLNSTLEEQVEARTSELRRLSENLERIVWERTAELEASRAELVHQARHDSLTGLPNRLLFEDRLEHAIERARREGTSVAVLFIDLDGFKLVNDSFGHNLGDNVLTSVSNRMRGRLRASDTIARHGGDEFAVVLEDLNDPRDALPVAQAILSSLERPFTIEGKTVRVSASIGVSLFPQDADTVQALQRHADVAMYRAKAAGKNDVRFYSPSMKAANDERMEIASRLSTALEREELVLHFQPQWDMHARRIWAFESLLRWHNPDLGSVAPTQLIPIAEEVGLMVEIGSWVLDESCRKAAQWTSLTGEKVGVAVNVSFSQLDRDDFITLVRNSLERHDLASNQLELELTESSVMHDLDIACRQMERVRNLGVRVAMDDFGLGSSSLSNLVHMPLDSVKIDRSFIQKLNQGNAADRVVQAIVALTNGIGLEVAAEGIETAAQRDRVIELGCHRLQGYLLGHPMDLDKIIDALRTQANSQFAIRNSR